MTQTNEKNCILSNVCKLAGKAQCKRSCASFISLHGASGVGGRIGAAHIPEDYRLLTVATMPTRDTDVTVTVDEDTQKAAKLGRTIDGYTKTFERQFDVIERSEERIKSLYLFSTSPGTGKTTTAASVLNTYIVANYIGSLKRGIQAIGRPGYFLDCNEFQTAYNTFNRPRVPDNIAAPAASRYYMALEHAQKSPFVVLDDIGVRDVSDGFRGDLHAIINYRVTNRLPTIYTSNVALKDLPKVFGEARLADRMGDLCLNVEYIGTSRRGMRKND